MTLNSKVSSSQYKKLSELVYKESGIVLNDKKYELLTARLAKRMRVTKTSSVSNYLKLMNSNEDEFINFIDAITTNHTFFFRENSHCEFLIKTLSKNKPLKIWSAASSSGEEAYSIAVQLAANSFKFDIFASDLSTTMLRLGQRAIYPDERVRSVPLPILRAYFQKGKGEYKNHVKVKPEIKKMVSFGKYNLLSDSPFDMKNKFDIIFCRNVMIYFDNPTRKKVVNNLFQSLKDGGYFFVGMSESLQGTQHGLTSILPSGYIKK
ncbi:MAG: protein-glutamate O-methyltransferase CheR [Desulfobacteraceae bacterium]|nr:protein-glutamate O-methyltransferase CheR [Desulfobacteraceae bacterium]